MKRILCILTVFISFSSILNALTLSQLRTEVRRNLRDTSATPSDQRYSDPTLLDYINEAQREITNITWLTEKTTEYILSPRTTYYNLPYDCINVEQVKFQKQNGSQWIVLDETSLGSLKRLNPTWETISGTPIQYFIDQTTYSTPSSSSTLIISYIPIPTNTSTGTVSVVYYNQPDDLSSDTDVPFNNKRHLYSYHMALVYHATMRLKAIEGRPDEAAFYNQLYTTSLKIMMEKIGRMPGYAPGASAASPK